MSTGTVAGVRLSDMTLGEVLRSAAEEVDRYEEAEKAARKILGATLNGTKNPVLTALWQLHDEVASLRRITAKGRMEAATEAFGSLIRKAPFIDREGENGRQMTQADINRFRDEMAESATHYADALLRALSKPQAEAGPATDADRPDPKQEGGADGVKPNP